MTYNSLAMPRCTFTLRDFNTRETVAEILSRPGIWVDASGYNEKLPREAIANIFCDGDFVHDGLEVATDIFTINSSCFSIPNCKRARDISTDAAEVNIDNLEVIGVLLAEKAGGLNASKIWDAACIAVATRSTVVLASVDMYDALRYPDRNQVVFTDRVTGFYPTASERPALHL